MFLESLFLGQRLREYVENQENFIAKCIDLRSLSLVQLGKKQIGVIWGPPLDGCYKVNIDCSHSKEGGSTCAGLVRRLNGSFVRGFYCKLGAENALWAELWGLR